MDKLAKINIIQVEKEISKYKGQLGIFIFKRKGNAVQAKIEIVKGKNITPKIYSWTLTPDNIRVLKFFFSFSSLTMIDTKQPEVILNTKFKIVIKKANCP